MIQEPIKGAASAIAQWSERGERVVVFPEGLAEGETLRRAHRKS